MKGLNTDKGEKILEMKNITKRFPGVVSNDHVNFDLRAGEVHSILGENGAGKTTLMNILYGLYRMDEGEILVNGNNVSIESPRDAIDLGIGMIHQFFTLVPGQSVMDNIILGSEPARGPFLDRRRAEREILELEEKFNISVDLKARPEQLSVSEKQKVEILKALFRGARILIMDEPTSVLMPQEKDEFMKTLREMTKRGVLSVIFITHKLPDAMAVSDRITILRMGKVVDTVEAKEVDRKRLAQKMIGRDVIFDITRSDTKKGEKILEVRELEALGDAGILALRGVSLHVREGEILGVAGVGGNGQGELVDVIVGLRRAEAGRVLIKGRDVTNLSPREIRDLGVGYIPEDRLGRAIMQNLSVRENLVLGVHMKHPFTRSSLLPLEKLWLTSRDQINSHAKRLVDEYNIDTPSVDKPAGKLSGGNIQRLILAREFSRDPDLLVAEKPTSGLDVGSQEFVRLKLMKEREKGKAILLISEDLDEIIMMSDRVAVMYEGRIVGTVHSEDVTKEQIGEMIIGVNEN